VSAYDAVKGYVLSLIAIAAAAGILALSWHYTSRRVSAKFLAKKLPTVFGDYELNLQNAFLKNTRAWRSAFSGGVSGWGKGTRRMLSEVLGAIEGHIQRLNDLHTDPSGRKVPAAESLTSAAEIEVTTDEASIDTGLVADQAQQILPPESDDQPKQASAG